MADAICSITGCEKPRFAREWCNGHYRRWQKRGTVDEHIPLGPWGRERTCREPGCDKPHSASSRCVDHQISYWHKKHAARLEREAAPPKLPTKAPQTEPRSPGAPLRRAVDSAARRARATAPPLRPRPQRCIGDRKVDPDGYVRIKVGVTYPGNSRGWLAEHRLVMERTLGRQLASGENVHHRNGVRHDNRPENLELWVVAQPRGQRPADLVEWAHEILGRYEADILRNQRKSQSTWTRAGAVALGTSRPKRTRRAAESVPEEVLQLHLDVSA